ncbi:MAG: hypothetical protein LBU79_05660 [Planctomycetota bacterium]|jgi:hypothetical protein|nr:hypothetical protein [Planctomycetota bacterium]
MASISVIYDFRGAKPQTVNKFTAALYKEFPKSLKMDDKFSFTLNLAGPVNLGDLRKKLRSLIPTEGISSYRFTIDMDGKPMVFSGP